MPVRAVALQMYLASMDWINNIVDRIYDMKDVLDIVKNIESIYESDTSFNVLKDFERVIDELDLYVYENWSEGELAMGPDIDRHWVTCQFMWPREKMPDPMGAKRLLDYDCKVRMGKDNILVPRKIRKEEDIRPGTKKGKLDRKPIWVVEIKMPTSLIGEVYGGYNQINPKPADSAPQEADVQANADAATDTPAPEGAV